MVENSPQVILYTINLLWVVNRTNNYNLRHVWTAVIILIYFCLYFTIELEVVLNLFLKLLLCRFLRKWKLIYNCGTQKIRCLNCLQSQILYLCVNPLNRPLLFVGANLFGPVKPHKIIFWDKSLLPIYDYLQTPFFPHHLFYFPLFHWLFEIFYIFMKTFVNKFHRFGLLNRTWPIIDLVSLLERTIQYVNFVEDNFFVPDKETLPGFGFKAWWDFRGNWWVGLLELDGFEIFLGKLIVAYFIIAFNLQ